MVWRVDMAAVRLIPVVWMAVGCHSSNPAWARGEVLRRVALGLLRAGAGDYSATTVAHCSSRPEAVTQSLAASCRPWAMPWHLGTATQHAVAAVLERYSPRLASPRRKPLSACACLRLYCTRGHYGQPRQGRAQKLAPPPAKSPSPTPPLLRFPPAV